MTCSEQLPEGVSLQPQRDLQNRWEILFRKSGDTKTVGWLSFNGKTWGGVAVPRKTRTVLEYTDQCCRKHLIDEILNDGGW